MRWIWSCLAMQWQEVIWWGQQSTCSVGVRNASLDNDKWRKIVISPPSSRVALPRHNSIVFNYRHDTPARRESPLLNRNSVYGSLRISTKILHLRAALSFTCVRVLLIRVALFETDSLNQSVEQRYMRPSRHVKHSTELSLENWCNLGISYLKF